MRTTAEPSLWLTAVVLLTMFAIVAGIEYSVPFEGAAFWFLGMVILMALR